jgi:nucleotide-binding universal stress UspA family protein
MSGSRKILIAVDGEAVSAHAAEVGLQLACCVMGEVALVQVVEPALTHAPGIAAEDLVAEARNDAKRILRAVQDSISPLFAAREFIRVGKPAHEILGVAKEWPADVIVVGSHGRHGIPRVLLGSVAEAVMRHSECPVWSYTGKRVSKRIENGVQYGKTPVHPKLAGRPAEIWL